MSELRKERIDRPIKARTDDIYALMGYREISYLLLPRVLPIAVLLILPLIVPNLYYLRVLNIALSFAILAASWDFLANYVGLVSLGHALFFGIGAYTAGAFSAYFDLPIFVTIPLATLIGATISTALIYPTLKVRGIYFSLITLAFPLLLARLIEATDILGGTLGITDVEGFPNPWVESYLLIFSLIVVVFGLRRLLGEDLGIVLRAIKDNDLTVEASGINVNKYRAIAVFISSAIASFVGAYTAHSYMFVGLPYLNLEYSIFPIAATVVGGMSSIAGAAIGAFILVPLSEALREFGTLRIAIYSLLLMLFIAIRPEGIYMFLWRKYHQIERWVKA